MFQRSEQLKQHVISLMLVSKVQMQYRIVFTFLFANLSVVDLRLCFSCLTVTAPVPRKKKGETCTATGPTPTNGRLSVKLGQSLACPEVTLPLLVSSSACVFMLRGVARRGERVIFSIESTLVRQTSKEEKKKERKRTSN